MRSLAAAAASRYGRTSSCSAVKFDDGSGRELKMAVKGRKDCLGATTPYERWAQVTHSSGVFSASRSHLLAATLKAQKQQALKPCPCTRHKCTQLSLLTHQEHFQLLARQQRCCCRHHPHQQASQHPAAGACAAGCTPVVVFVGTRGAQYRVLLAGAA